MFCFVYFLKSTSIIVKEEILIIKIALPTFVLEKSVRLFICHIKIKLLVECSSDVAIMLLELKQICLEVLILRALEYPFDYSNSMVPGGLEVISYTTRLTWLTSFTILVAMISKTG